MKIMTEDEELEWVKRAGKQLKNRKSPLTGGKNRHTIEKHKAETGNSTPWPGTQREDGW